MILAFIARIVTNHVLPIVKITHVKYRAEIVLNVHLDGLGPFVLMVIFLRNLIFIVSQLFYKLPFQLKVKIETDNQTQLSCLSLKIECREGWYGENCTQQCIGHCRDNTICNHVTGVCERGCSLGWTGTFCENGNFYLVHFRKYLNKIFTKYRDIQTIKRAKTTLMNSHYMLSKLFYGTLHALFEKNLLLDKKKIACEKFVTCFGQLFILLSMVF